jgi:hypothetical protein
MDRMLGVLSILLMGVAALFVARDLPVGRGIFITLGVAAGACAVAALLVFSDRVDAIAQSFVIRLPWSRAQLLAAGLLDAMRRYSRFHGELINVLALSIAVQALRVLQAYCLGRALGITHPATVYFVLIPIALLIMLLPITVNGLGTGQLAFVALFGDVGVPYAQAFALSILFIALGVVGNLPGGILYAAEPTPARGSRVT